MKEITLSKGKFTTKQITVIGTLFAVTIVLGVTGLGFIPIPPFKSTIMHIPVIIGAILEGPLVGAMIGLLFGLFSMFQALNTFSPVTFVFLNPIVAILPRMLIGVTSYYAYKICKTKSISFNISIGTAIGSFTNTIGVLGLIYILYIDEYAKALNMSQSVATKTLLALVFNGFVSAGTAIVITVPVVLAVKRFK
ncbi:ECF transporter S component [Inediibacterium massiliense]|uniref:ECF transporter S component n=1 Tax=Inediibacterium massiliense TaxID=1658111 RepID=UPI0006B4C810|nr:ECF transporter S component [Inediibacterium massiliense]